MARTIIVEVCPGCGSLDVRAVEPHWFILDIDRRPELHDDGHAVDALEFGCRDCGLVWS